MQACGIYPIGHDQDLDDFLFVPLALPRMPLKPARSVNPPNGHTLPTCRILLPSLRCTTTFRINLNFYVEHMNSSLHAYLFFLIVHTLRPPPLIKSPIVIELSYFLIGVSPNRVPEE
jgi:hypothetical protein